MKIPEDKICILPFLLPSRSIEKSNHAGLKMRTVNTDRYLGVLRKFLDRIGPMKSY